MITKIVLDGTLFTECERLGSNRSGMQRVAEDVTANLASDTDLDICFASTYEQDDTLLRRFVSENYPLYKNKVLLRKTFVSSGIPKVRGVLRKINTFMSDRAYLKEIGKGDVFHSFYYPFPEGIQKRKIKKSIVNLDIIALRLKGYPEDLIERTKEIVESIVPNFAISISEFSKQDLLDYDKRIEEKRVFVVPLAASEKLFFRNKDVDDWNAAKERYKLPDNFFLSVSSSDSRKNVPHLIKSFNRFILQQNPKDLYLVLTGNSTYSYTILDELKIGKKVKDKIIITDKYIASQDLAVVYSNALCFFFMSIYEGFGLPVLEAMQCGTPVVTSNATSLPEVVGNAGITIDPHDEDSLCHVMHEMYVKKEMRERYAQLGFERAKQFSWRRCAREYAEIFRSIS